MTKSRCENVIKSHRKEFKANFDTIMDAAITKVRAIDLPLRQKQVDEAVMIFKTSERSYLFDVLIEPVSRMMLMSIELNNHSNIHDQIEFFCVVSL